MYRQVEARFWTAGSGKALRGKQVAQLVALYLMTCASSNMAGLYYLALPTLAHELGIPIEGAREALLAVEAVGIALYDEASELVYLPRMAAKQVGETLRANDKRIASVAKLLEQHGNHRFARAFRERYGVAFNLPPAPEAATTSPLEAPSMPLRSQDQDQEQEQEQGRGSTRGGEAQRAKARTKPAVERATRLPEGWAPSPSTLAWCATKGVDVTRTLERFALYWRATSGAKARKLDWDATFKSWVLRDLDGVRGATSKARAPLQPAPADGPAAWELTPANGATS